MYDKFIFKKIPRKDRYDIGKRKAKEKIQLMGGCNCGQLGYNSTEDLKTDTQQVLSQSDQGIRKSAINHSPYTFEVFAP